MIWQGWRLGSRRVVRDGAWRRAWLRVWCGPRYTRVWAVGENGRRGGVAQLRVAGEVAAGDSVARELRSLLVMEGVVVLW